MRVVDTRDFCIPSDENDYDELVTFADTMANISQFDAVPIEVLNNIRAEIEQEYNHLRSHLDRSLVQIGECLGLQKSLKIIDKYKAESEE